MKIYYYTLVIIIITLIFSCTRKNLNINSNIEKEMHEHYLEKQFSKYQIIYNSVVDTLEGWKKDSLYFSKYIHYSFEAKPDSVLVFNSDSSRFYSSILIRDIGHKEAIYDYLESLGGARIRGKWYFFIGINTTLNRASYQDSIYSPLTFEELSYLSRQELSGAYTINPDGSITTNDRFFDFMYNRNGWGLPEHSTLEQLDSVIIAKNIKKHQNKIDPKELENIKKEMANSVRPSEPQKKKRSLWDSLFKEEEIKIFESKEWKEYLKKKYGKLSEQ